MKQIILKCFLSFMFFLPVFSKENSSVPDSINLNNTSLISINNVSMWARSDGVLAKGPNYINGVVYPKGTASVIYADGFLWGGFVHDNRIPLLRAGGSLYVSGLTPGKILSGGIRESIDPSERTIWNIRKDYETADLTETARILFNYKDTTNHPKVEEINKVRKMYKESWKTWPWEKGAPFYDDNNNGIMDSGEKPGLLNADQVVWFVCNDEDAYKCYKFLGSPPFGIELQVTLWAYNRRGGNMEQALQQTVFRRYRFIYKGTEDTPDSARIDSMFISIWSDCEIGNRLDDYVGCDTLLDLMFGYNSSTIDDEFEKYNLSPPAAGYTLLQGPIVFTGNSRDKALCVSGEKYLYKNLNLSSFNYFAGNDNFSECSILETYGVYDFTLQWYNLMNGLGPRSGTPYLDAFGKPDLFPLSDDPANEGKDIDGIQMWPTERKMQFHSGPFSMAVGDTQDVVIAVVGGIGSDRLASVSVMKLWTRWVRYFYKYQLWEELELPPDQEEKPLIPTHFALKQNYPNPFNNNTKIVYSIPVECKVHVDIYDSLGKHVTSMVNETVPAGIHTILWEASEVPSGIFLCRMKAGKVTRTIKMVVLK